MQKEEQIQASKPLAIAMKPLHAQGAALTDVLG